MAHHPQVRLRLKPVLTDAIASATCSSRVDDGPGHRIAESYDSPVSFDGYTLVIDEQRLLP